MLFAFNSRINLEPPVILPSTPADYTAVENNRVEMMCHASGSPQPEITWYRRGTAITDQTEGARVFSDGRLVLTSVDSSDHGQYICR